MKELTEMSVDELLQRQQELAEEIQAETRDQMTTEEIEQRANDLEAVKKELEARKEAARQAEETRKEVAQDTGKKPIAEIEKENRKMSYEVNTPEYRDAFLRNLQGKELTAEERTAVVGSAAIPTQTMNEIVHKLELNPLIGAVDLTNIPGYVTYPAEDVVNEASWLDMGVGATDSTDALTPVTLGAYKLIKTVEITADVDAMSVDAFEAWLVSRLINKIEKALDAGILKGTGTTQATGIATTKATADGTFKRAGIKWGDICGIMGKLPGQYHANASFVMNPSLFFGKVLGMVDTAGQRIVVNEPQAARKFNILGYPVIVDGNCNAEDILFGDFKAYKLNLAKGIEVKKSEEAEFRKGASVYRAMTLADGKLADTNAIVRYVATT